MIETKYGWNAKRQEEWEQLQTDELIPGRVVLEHKRLYRVMTATGELLSEVSGKFAFDALDRQDFPAVGDWVAVSVREGEGKAIIHKVLERSSQFSRKAAGYTFEEQLVAVNVDTVMLVMALTNDFNPRRMERYVLLAYESGANPVIVLSKRDLCADLESPMDQLERDCPGVPIHAVSSLTGEGLEQLSEYLTEGKTIALLGSSGAGKSSLTNAFMDHQVQKVNETRLSDDRGKHTTTHRELFLLPSGAAIIDTPGMREIQLLGAENGMEQSYEDIYALADSCKFNDCKHQHEPGCRVQEAIQTGELSEQRYLGYVKLLKEQAFAKRQADKREMMKEKKRWKQITKSRRK
ncbi:ribosome small subunit-dependent GTPase A [Alkalicoccobacillus gibsonii]|uniref:ribosome small subunit-dependent GTPase A n=1 Tax=Alkalicoccobacillus gibsonii TaxID=79881 RepID=UPI0019346DAC|nr:ribosome small subunit-dependent GTPase A [Alkalicoccobacillus gibsonii]MBM0066672.1 ribosome small subunit-dependent GTPase A [Alkalicoccobacillus gibsonii]